MNESIITLVWIIAKILLIIVPLLLAVAYTTLAERKVIGFMQGRVGPNTSLPVFKHQT